MIKKVLFAVKKRRPGLGRASNNKQSGPHNQERDY